jgi:hypothetical protein
MNTSKLLRLKSIRAAKWHEVPKPPPCICGRGEYYHPWRFCDKYTPALNGGASGG